MATADKEEDSDEEERTIAEAHDDIIGDIISVDSDGTHSNTELPDFSHLTIIDNESDAVYFTAELQNVAVEHTLALLHEDL